jgi:dTDP-4-dehydrorhamnose reductase
VDVADFPALEALLRNLAPQVVVNCVGVIKQRSAAKSPIPSIRINALFPHLLAECLARQGSRLIHFSTDCVFSGRKGNYAEDDPSDAEDLYGKTKFLGEVATPNALTLRTSIIGRELSQFASLLDWFLAQRGKTVRGFARVIYSGLTTNYLAKLVGDLIVDQPALHGLYQLASDPISKYDLLSMLRDAFGLDVELERETETVSDRSLDGTRFAAETGIRTPAWADLVEALAADPTPYERWR